MKLRTKIFLPIAIVLLILGALGYVLMEKQLAGLKTHMHLNTLQHKQVEIMTGIDLLSQQLISRAAVFTELPAVLEALRIANSGNIADETDPKGQIARELLRTALAAHLAGHATQHGGDALKLHFYLANGRSLARLWRKKQLKRDGKWLDVSDDISHFRQMVIDIQTQQGVLRGIELGKAGFVVRGMIPINDVVDDNGNIERLGAVEVLMPLNILLESAVKELNASLSLWMPSQYLTITTRLQNPEHYPILAAQYVRVYTTENVHHISPSLTLLEQGLHHLTLQQYGKIAIGAFPIHDYTRQAIGVLVYEFDVSTLEQMQNQVSLVLLLVLAIMLLLIGTVTYLIVNGQITQPLLRISADLKTLAQGQFNTTELEYRGADEIAEIAHSTRQLNSSLRRTIDQANAIAIGDYRSEVQLLSDQDQLGQALSDMMRTLRGVIQQANAIAAGHYQTNYQLLSEQDELGQALIEMTNTLRALETQRQQQDWLKTGQTQLHDQLSGEQTVKQLADKIVNFLTDYLEVNVSAFYVAEYDADEQKIERLVLLSSHAYTLRKQLANGFKLGEGYIGQAALERKLLVFSDTATNYAILADQEQAELPNCTVVMPFSYEHTLKGILELAAGQPFSDIQLTFLTQIAPSLGVVINTAESRTRMQVLLAKVQAQVLTQ